MSARTTAEHRQERHEAYLLLHGAGWSDGAIARVTQISSTAIRHWRAEHGLAPNSKFRGGAEIDGDRALEVYNEGGSDVEIGKALGITASSARGWRSRLGLPPNFEPCRPMDTALRKKAERMLAQGASRRQVADAVERGTLKSMSIIRSRLRSQHMRQSGMNRPYIQRKVLNDASILSRIQKAIGAGMPEDIAQDAILEMYADVLEGLINAALIEKLAPSYRSKAFEICGSKFGPKSIDEKREDGWSLSDTLEDPNALDAFDALDDSFL